MKKVIQILLLGVVAALGYWLYTIIVTPVEFQATKAAREEVIIERLKDIRKAQRAYKMAYGRYTTTMDSLIDFIEKDSLTFEIKFGSEDDSVAVAKGLVRTEKIKFAVIDTIFNGSVNVDEFRKVPFTDNEKYIMDATALTTESKVVVPVFEVKVPFKMYLKDLDNQLLINTIDEAKSIERYPGLKVGSLEKATNDAGNWE